MNIVPVASGDIDAQRWIRWLDGEVFTDAEGPLSGAGPVTFHGSHWFIGWDGDKPVCYAGWRPHFDSTELHFRQPLGFLYRGGVLECARGHGYQKELIRVREEGMRAQGIATSITYTDPLSIGSMKNLMACGYEPYLADKTTALYSMDAVYRFVHWRKDL
jgi:hypothetical protein